MYNRKHRKLKPEEYKSYQESYRQENAEKIRTLSFNYYQQNTELIKDKNYTYRIQRLQDDPIYRLIDCYRTRVRNALKSQIKSEKTMDLIGCTADFLRKWIEAKWVLGMNWSNYGYGKDKWNVDHIIPCASFDRSKESERRKCFHYTNLQPLWQIDNFAKAAKLNYEH